MGSDKKMAAFRLTPQTLERLDALVEWMDKETKSVGGFWHRPYNRTSVIERLVSLEHGTRETKIRQALENGKVKEAAGASARRQLAPAVRTKEQKGKRHVGKK